MGSATVAPAAAEAGSDLDDLGASSRRRRYLLLLLGLLAVFLATVVAAVGMGAVSVPPLTVLDIVGHHLVGSPAEVTWRPAHDSIVWRVRLPRVLLGAAVGAGLAVTGMALQAMVRNMLADPYLLGVNSGGSTGAAAAILFGFGAGWGEHALQFAAFLGALAASLLVFVIARTAGRVTSTRLLMTGVAVGYALYALTSFRSSRPIRPRVEVGAVLAAGHAGARALVGAAGRGRGRRRPGDRPAHAVGTAAGRAGDR